MRTTADELAGILAKHLAWLRGESGGERANLSSADLRSADLRLADLRLANLSSADLSSADLRLANLSSADLSSADLRSADLRLADLRLADLRLANLSSADLRSANLSLAKLRSADLRLANLSSADLVFVRDDIWAVLSASPAEVPALRDAIAGGRIDGSCYTGSCCCLVGTLAKARGCKEYEIPGLQPSAGRAAEAWFTAIKPGQTPDEHEHVKLTLAWVDDWLSRIREAIPALCGSQTHHPM
jgi:hypothetical protein